jgi:hypothetical protein
MQITKTHLIAILLLAVASIQLEQYATWGTIWDWGQIEHHESASIVLIAVAITIYFVAKRKVKV